MRKTQTTNEKNGSGVKYLDWANGLIKKQLEVEIEVSYWHMSKQDVLFKSSIQFLPSDKYSL